MAEGSSARDRVRIGDLLIDLATGEVLNNGTRARLQVQSLELLKALLERRGTMISREELRRRLWPNDTFVDFDHGLNAAVRRLRETLGDSADSPRFIETIPRKGYRLVAATDGAAPAPAAAGRTATTSPDDATPRTTPRVAHSTRVNYVTIAIGLAAIAIAGAWLARGPRPASLRPPFTTFTIDVPSGWNIQPTDHLAVSPDGSAIAFSAAGPDHRGALWVRKLMDPVARQVPGTERAAAPFWSADGARVGFFANGTLKAVTLADGRVHTLIGVAPVVFPTGAAAWTRAADILFVPLSAALGTPVHAAMLRRLDAGTGAVTPVPAFSEPRDYVDHVAPSAIPGTNAFTFVRWKPSTLAMTAHVGEVGTPRIVDLGRTESRVIVTADGHAVFVREGTLVAQAFDVATRRLAGAPLPLAQEVAVYQPMLGHFAASSDVIVYMTRAAMTSGMQLRLVGRDGAALRTIADGAEFSSPRVSADGMRVAVGQRDPVSGTRDIWLHAFDGSTPIRLTFDGHDDVAPAWSADGRTILFTSDRSGERDVYRKEVAGGKVETLAFASPESKSLNAWSPDGQFFVYDNGARASIDAHGRLNKNLMTVSLSGTPRARPLAVTAASESTADISPDGMLVAYQSTETGRAEIFVETFPDKSGRWQATFTGAVEPMWRGDGRELFFVSTRDELCAVDVHRTGGSVRFGTPRVLFALHNAPSTTRRYATLPDGQRFVTLVAQPHLPAQQLTVLLNWRSALPN